MPIRWDAKYEEETSAARKSGLFSGTEELEYHFRPIGASRPPKLNSDILTGSRANDGGTPTPYSWCAMSPIVSMASSPWSHGNDSPKADWTPTCTPGGALFSVADKLAMGFKSASGTSTPTGSYKDTDSMATIQDNVRFAATVKKPKEEPLIQDGKMVAKQVRTENATTVMVRNVNNRVCADGFAEKLNSLGFENCFDLCLIPTDPCSGRGKGYGFINFVDSEVAAAFCELAESISFERTTGKTLQVAVARYQGVEETLQNRTVKAKKKCHRAGSIVCTANTVHAQA